MPRMKKKAEHEMTDAGKFPIESCRERIARTYGLDAVALSGPSEGANLADAVCLQLQKRWDKIQSRFAGDRSKTVRLALKLAESFSQAGDTVKCVEHLASNGFDKKASSHIAEYLKAYAMDETMDKDLDGHMDDVEEEDTDFKDGAKEETKVEDGLGGKVVEETLDIPDDGGDGEGADEADEDDEGEEGDEDGDFGEPDEDDFGGEDDGDEDDNGENEDEDEFDLTMPSGTDSDEDMDEEMVTFHLPRQVAEEIVDNLQHQMINHKYNNPAEVGGDAEESDMSDEGMEGPEEPGMTGGVAENDEIPGEPEEKQPGDGQTVVGCEGAVMAGKKDIPESFKKNWKDKDGEKDEDEHEEDEHEKDGKSKKGVPEAFKKKQKEGKDEDDGEESEKPMFGKASKKGRVATAYAEMGSGNKPTSEKEKAVEDPKPLEDGNVKPEGFTAGGDKFQDHGTLGREKPFDAKDVDKSSVTGGQSSIMGPDESYPKGKADVPAGSAPIHGEEFEGGDVATKGTVIATVTPEGILVQTPEKKSFLVKAKISEPNAEDLENIGKAIKALPYDGDGPKFARMALKAAKAASKVALSFGPKGVVVRTPFDGYVVASRVSKLTKKLTAAIDAIPYDGDCRKFAEALKIVLAGHKEVDGEEHTDNSELEAKNFTNDAEKEPQGDSRAAKSGGPSSGKEDGETHTDNSELEAKNFTNDAEKEPEADKKAGNRMFQKKTAGEKKVEDPEPVEKNMDPKGYTAGDKKVSDMAQSTQGSEKAPAFATVTQGDVSDGKPMGEEPKFTAVHPEVPSVAVDIDLSTKGTVIGNKKSDAILQIGRLKAASVYVADLLRNGDIKEDEYAETLEKYAKMPVEAIQALIVTTKTARANAVRSVESRNAAAMRKEAGLSVPLVIPSSSKEKTLKDELVGMFRLTQNLDKIDAMPTRK